MSQQLTVEISDKAYEDLEHNANAIGLSAAEWVAELINRHNVAEKPNSVSTEERERAWESIMSYAGSISDVGSVDNNDIDADLAKEYGNGLSG